MLLTEFVCSSIRIGGLDDLCDVLLSVPRKQTNKKQPCLTNTEDSFQSGDTSMGPRIRSDVAPLFFNASSILSDVCMSEFGKSFREEGAGHHQQKALHACSIRAAADTGDHTEDQD